MSANLANVGAFAGHVGASDERERIVGGEMRIIGHELGAKLLFEDRMTAIDDIQHAIFNDSGAGNIAVRSRGRLSRREHRRGRDRARVPGTGDMREQALADLLEERLFESNGFVLGARASSSNFFSSSVM